MKRLLPLLTVTILLGGCSSNGGGSATQPNHTGTDSVKTQNLVEAASEQAVDELIEEIIEEVVKEVISEPKVKIITPAPEPINTFVPTPPPAPIKTIKLTPTIKTRPTSNCDPNYSGCVPIASDVDCYGGTGNGPAYVRGPVRVIGRDIYGLDRDKDGYGCE